MPKTVIMEELSHDARRVLEEMLIADEPVILSRNGKPVGSVFGYRQTKNVMLPPLSLEEIHEIQDAVREGNADYAAGRFITLDQFEEKYVDKLRDGDS